MYHGLVVKNNHNGLRRRVDLLERAYLEDRKRWQKYEEYQKKTDGRLAKLMLLLEKQGGRLDRHEDRHEEQNKRLENQNKRLEEQGKRLEEQGKRLDVQSRAIEAMTKLLHRHLES